MQINIALEQNNKKQAEIIRKEWYPNTTARQTRDAFIFNDCIDRYTGKPQDLLPLIERNEGTATVQRMLTIKADSNERLKTIASAINKPIATTYRAIICYTVDNINKTDNLSKKTVTESVGIPQLVNEKLAMLQKQVDACSQTLNEIRVLMEEN